MEIIIIQGIGALIFLSGSIWLGEKIRKTDNNKTAENASRISHLLFWCALLLPGIVGLFYPGIKSYDKLLNISGLPDSTVLIVAGSIFLCSGLILMIASNRSLIIKGRGAAAFLLTKELVSKGLYEHTRNPMSLGFYAACVGIGMIAKSFTITFAAILIIIPIHILNLKYFEERELEMRYGQAYTDYKKRVPFLIPKLKHK